jgi:hypothetical protein
MISQVDVPRAIILFDSYYLRVKASNASELEKSNEKGSFSPCCVSEKTPSRLGPGPGHGGKTQCPGSEDFQRLASASFVGLAKLSGVVISAIFGGSF